MDTTERAAAMALAALPRLESLSVGGMVGNLSSVKNSTVIASWPWTGRREAFVFETWPL